MTYKIVDMTFRAESGQPNRLMATTDPGRIVEVLTREQFNDGSEILRVLIEV